MNTTKPITTSVINGSLNIGSNTDDNIKALDLGWGINTGYLFSSGFYARAHYQMGLTNLCPFGDAKDDFKTSAYGVTIGYYVNGSKHNKSRKATQGH